MSLVKISGNASGTGTLTIAAPNTNTNRTLTLPDNTGTFLTSATTTGFPAGSVLKVASTAKTDTFSTSSTTFTDLTGLSVSITPSSATSKIMVFVSVNGSIAAATNQLFLRLMRDSTAVAIGDSAGSRVQTSIDAATPSADCQTSCIINWLDSPSTTSATVYKVQIRANAASSVFINRRQDDTDASTRARTVSTITVMEIAA